MLPFDLALLGLLCAALATSLIELGLSAYVTSVGYHVSKDVYSSYYEEYLTYYVNYGASSQIAYLVFDSVWSLLVTGALLLIAFVLPASFNPSGKALGIATVILTFITMVHWFAGFAALAAWFGGIHLQGTLAAVLAFAVINWLIYLALTVLTFLTAAGILKSERRGRSQLFGRDRHAQTAQPSQTYMQPMQQQPAQPYAQPVHPQQQPMQPYAQPMHPQQQPQHQPGPYKTEETETVQKVSSV